MDFKRRPRLSKFIALFFILAFAGTLVGQCVIPGATTVVQSTPYSPLAADTGKIYYVTSSVTFTLPSSPPTAVWRIGFQVTSGNTLTINPNGLQIDQASPNETYTGPASVTVSTDGSNYYTSGKGGGGTSTPANFWQSPGTVSGAIGFSANVLRGSVINVPVSTTISKFSVNVTTLDGANSYAFGLYPYTSGGTCSLVAHAAPASYASTGEKEISVVEGTVTLSPGFYFFGATGNAGTLQITVSSAQDFTPFPEGSTGVTTSGGAVPASFTCPTAAWTYSNVDFFAVHN